MASKEDIRSSRRLHRRTLTPEHIATAGESLARHGTAWAAELSPRRAATFAVYLGVAFEPPTIPPSSSPCTRPGIKCCCLFASLAGC